MAKKKRRGNKKRVAAHIRENQGKRAAAAASGEGELGADKRAPLLAPPLGVGKPKRPREPEAAPSRAAGDDPARRAKERNDANNYLAAWLSVRKAKEAAEEAGVAPPPATGVWKFNKNTQAWLLRHVFSDEQIDDKSFGTLCLYLEGLKGAGRQRVLAAAQEIIDKHGPNEGEEQTAAAREAREAETAAASAAAAAVAAEHTSDAAAAEAAPSGYNSESTDEGEGGGGGAAEGGKDERGVVAPPAATGAGGGGSEFAFSFFDGEGKGVEAAKLPQTAVVKPLEQCDSDSASGSSSSSSGDDSGDDDDGEGKGKGEHTNEAKHSLPAAPATKKPRKARSALTGQSKAEAKAKAAAVAYERALQVAEVLA